MTQMLNINVTCPNCGTCDTAEVWASVNAAENPQEAQYLIDGFLFSWTCPACGHAAALNHDCLYHDPNRKVMVQYVANADDARHAASALAPLRAEGYEVRVVASRESLREKAALARDGLDDRAVELLKFLLFNKFVAEGAVPATSVAYYGALDEEGGIVVEFVGQGEPLESTVPRDVYETAVGQIPHLDSDLLEAFCVDRAWAARANGQLAR